MIARISVLFVSMVVVSLWARDEYTRTFDKTLTVNAGAKVYLEHRLGDVTIRTHPDPTVVIHAVIKASAATSDQAKALAERIEILTEPSSSEISIRTRYPEGARSFRDFRATSFYVNYELTIPQNAPLEVRNSFGSVTAVGLRNGSQITTSHGGIDLRDGRGVEQLQTSFANVRVDKNVGDVSVQGTNGAIEVQDIQGALSVRDRFGSVTVAHVSKGVNVANSNGAVDVTGSGGDGSVRNSFGTVSVHDYNGAMTVENANGRVEALNVHGTASLHTTFGEVKFSNIGQQLLVHATNSRITGDHVGGPVTVESSFGPVNITDIRGNVTVHSANAGVSLARIQGAANVRTSFGMVEANEIGGALVVMNSNGQVQASHVRGAQVATSFAAVTLDRVSGPLQVANQNGAVEAMVVGTATCQPISIETSFSPLRLRLAGEVNYRVTARTSFSKIRTDYPLNVLGSLSSDNVTGSIGAGRCDMTLINRNGTVEILKTRF